MDGDGDPDVIAASGDMTSAARWWENPRPDGDPKKGPWNAHGPARSGGEIHDLDVADINGDGKMDVASRHKTSTLDVLFQTSSGWTHKSISLAGVEGTAFADFDGDGDMDICDGTSWYETPANILSGGSWTKHTFGSFGCKYRRVCIADWNKDGNLDVAISVAEAEKCQLKMYFGPNDAKSGSWTEHIILSESHNYNFHTLEAADFDLDEHLDLLVGTTHGGLQAESQFLKQMRIFFNEDGKGTQWKDTIWTTAKGVWQAQVADIGSDGDWDILNCDYGANIGQFEYWENLANPGTTVINSKAAGSSISEKLYSINAGRIEITSARARALDVRGRAMTSRLQNAGTAGIVLIADKQSGRISTLVPAINR
jgi:hypothetical protein